MMTEQLPENNTRHIVLSYPKADALTRAYISLPARAPIDLRGDLPAKLNTMVNGTIIRELTRSRRCATLVQMAYVSV